MNDTSSPTPLPTAGKWVDAGAGNGLEEFAPLGRQSEVEISEVSNPPMVLDQPNTTYKLTADVEVPAGAFEIAANYVTLDLDGHTITYGTEPTSTPTEVFGVRVNSDIDNVAIVNGKIVKGMGGCDGSAEPTERSLCNPIRVRGSIGGETEIAGLDITLRGGTFISAVHAGPGVAALNVHNVRITDETSSEGSEFSYAAIHHDSPQLARIHDNHIVGASRIGIWSGGAAEIYDNVIELETDFAEFSGGIRLEGTTPNTVVRDNEITATGNGAIGIFIEGAPQGTIVSNHVVAETTRGSSNRAASAFLIVSGDASDLTVSCNWLEVVAGTQFDVGGGGLGGTKNWGLAVRLRNGVQFRENFVRAYDHSGDSFAGAISTVGTSGASGTNIVVSENVIASNHTHIYPTLNEAVLTLDEGEYMTISGNQFVREGVDARFALIRNSAATDQHAAAVIVDNTLYDGGITEITEEMADLSFCNGFVDIGIGLGATVDYWLTEKNERINSAMNAVQIEDVNCMEGYRVIPD